MQQQYGLVACKTKVLHLFCMQTSLIWKWFLFVIRCFAWCRISNRVGLCFCKRSGIHGSWTGFSLFHTIVWLSEISSVIKADRWKMYSICYIYTYTHPRIDINRWLFTLSNCILLFSQLLRIKNWRTCKKFSIFVSI